VSLTIVDQKNSNCYVIMMKDSLNVTDISGNKANVPGISLISLHFNRHIKSQKRASQAQIQIVEAWSWGKYGNGLAT
jgi:hypothetical protein